MLLLFQVSPDPSRDSRQPLLLLTLIVHVSILRNSVGLIQELHFKGIVGSIMKIPLRVLAANTMLNKSFGKRKDMKITGLSAIGTSLNGRQKSIGVEIMAKNTK